MSRMITLGLFALTVALCLVASDQTQASSSSATAPAGITTGVAMLNERLGIDTPWREALDEAIDPDDYECDLDSDFRDWIGDTIGAIDPATLGVIFNYGVDLWPTYYSLLIDNDSSDDYIGVDGEYTKELVKRHKDNQKFWDVSTDDVLLMGMHGAVIADDSKMVPTVQLLFGAYNPVTNDLTPLPAAIAQSIVDLVQATIDNDNSIDYDHPLFTLNAFAFSDEGVEVFTGFGLLPDKIVMGEGILEAYDDIGLDANAPDMIHAHEFVHHVQFELGAFGASSPEGTRRTELMADAFGAYYLAHAKGATFQAKRIVDTFKIVREIGDCNFASPGHHGTPNQREAAAMWGAELAASAKKQGHVNSATLMLTLFELELPDLIAPDAD